MKKQLFFILILFWSIDGYSQIKFESGYFVNIDGNKVNCFIKNMDWKNNPIEFSYKLSENSEVKTADIKSVLEFGISDFIKYKRFTVDIDKSSEDMSQLSKTRNPEFSKDELFLKVLVEGKATLFSYENGYIRKYFFCTDSLKVEQLVFKSYLHSELELMENNSYKQQLLNILKCQKITMKDIDKIHYRNTDLVRLFTIYNECQNSATIDYEKKTDRDIFKLSLRPGLNLSNLLINSPSNDINIDFGNKLTYRLGAEAEYIMPFNKNKWALIIEPTFQYYKSEFTKNRQYYKIDYKSIELPLGVRYYIFLNEKSKIYVNSSFVVDFDLNSEISTVNGTWADIDSKPNWAFGLGYKQNNKFTFEMRYGLSRDLIPFSSFYSHYKTFSIILGYNVL